MTSSPPACHRLLHWSVRQPVANQSELAAKVPARHRGTQPDVTPREPAADNNRCFFQEETSRLNPELVRFQRVDRPLTGPRPAAAAPAAKEPANPLKNKNTHNSRARSSGGGGSAHLR